MSIHVLRRIPAPGSPLVAYVVPAYRGGRIARRLVQHGEAAAARLGHDRVRRYTTTATGVYARLGRELVTEAYGGQAVTIMVKALGSGR